MTDVIPNVSALPGAGKPLEAVTYGVSPPNMIRGRSEDGTPLQRQCTAMSTRSGKRCRKWAIKGSTVCPTHGGRAPQVKERARLRLQSFVEPAIATLAREMTGADKSADRQRAANSILDRTGFGRQVKVEATDAREMLLDLLIQAAEDEKG